MKQRANNITIANYVIATNRYEQINKQATLLWQIKHMKFFA